MPRISRSVATISLSTIVRSTVVLSLSTIVLSLSTCVNPVNMISPLWTPARPAPRYLSEPIVKEARLAVSFVGHATVLVQMGDKILLTDPVLTRTVGQVSARLVAPGIDTDRIPPLSAVLISHAHFDHLSLGSLEQIADRIGTLILPKRGLVYLTDFPFVALELEPWQTWEKDGLKVTATPNRHSGWRYGLDTWMDSAHTGYVIEYRQTCVYFAGDTAYDREAFAATRQRFPRIDLALLPIAPIEPRSFMQSRHMDPAEAVQAFLDLGAETMLAIHFDTFVNGNDRMGDAPRRLHEIAEARGLDPSRVITLPIGEQRVIIPGAPSPCPSVLTQ